MEQSKRMKIEAAKNLIITRELTKLLHESNDDVKPSTMEHLVGAVEERIPTPCGFYSADLSTDNILNYISSCIALNSATFKLKARLDEIEKENSDEV